MCIAFLALPSRSDRNGVTTVRLDAPEPGRATSTTLLPPTNDEVAVPETTAGEPSSATVPRARAQSFLAAPPRASILGIEVPRATATVAPTGSTQPTEAPPATFLLPSYATQPATVASQAPATTAGITTTAKPTTTVQATTTTRRQHGSTSSGPTTTATTTTAPTTTAPTTTVATTLPTTVPTTITVTVPTSLVDTSAVTTTNHGGPPSQESSQ